MKQSFRKIGSLLLLSVVLASVSFATYLELPGGSLLGRRNQNFDLVEDLNEKVWYYWDYTTLANGAVSSFPESMVGGAIGTLSQGTGGLQPTKDADGIDFTGTQKLSFASHQSELAIRQLRTLGVLIDDFDATSVTAGSTIPLVSFNGTAGTANHRNPGIFYIKDTNVFRGYFGAAGSSVEVPAGTSGDPKFLLLYKIDGTMYMSLNGDTPVSASAETLPPKSTTTFTGGIVGNNTVAADWTLKKLFVLQGELTEDEEEVIPAWALWDVGSQAFLDAGNPYTASRPQAAGHRFVSTWDGDDQDYWDDVWLPNWNGAYLNSHNGEDRSALIATLDEVFIDDGTSLTIASEDAAPGAGINFHAPVQSHIGARTDMRIATIADDPGNYAQSGSNLAISITWDAGAGQFVAPVFTTLNRDGRGRTWNPGERPTMFEIRMKNANSGIDAWLGMWIKSANEFARGIGTNGTGLGSEPYVEIDSPEIYNPGDNNVHSSFHEHNSLFRDYLARQPNDRFTSDTVNLGAAGTWPNKPQNPYDDQFHTYAWYCDRDVMIWMLDGLELIRMPSSASSWQPLYLLFNISIWNTTPSVFGDHTTYIDTIRVLQGDLYANDSTPESLRDAPQRVASNIIPFRPRRQPLPEIKKVCPPWLYRCAA